jgi:hypothetical protein
VQIDVGGAVNDGQTGAQIKGQTFHVHKTILTKTSDFLRAALKQEWQGPTPRPIDLTDEDPKYFGMYVQWLYTGKVSVPRITYIDNGGTKVETPSSKALARTYVLGARLVDSAFQNAILQAIMDCADEDHCSPGLSDIGIIYAGTVALSPARKLMVDIWTHYAHEEWKLKNVVGIAGEEFANDLVQALIKRRPPPDGTGTAVAPWVKKPQNYMVKEL